jgi:hypothetical protein
VKYRTKKQQERRFGSPAYLHGITDSITPHQPPGLNSTNQYVPLAIFDLNTCFEYLL